MHRQQHFALAASQLRELSSSSTVQLLMPGTVYLQESLTQDIACTVPVAEPATLHGDGDGKAFSSSDKVSEKARVVFDTCWRRLEERHPVRPLCFGGSGGASEYLLKQAGGTAST